MTTDKQSQISQRDINREKARYILRHSKDEAERIRALGYLTMNTSMMGFGVKEAIMEAYGVKPSTDDL